MKLTGKQVYDVLLQAIRSNVTSTLYTLQQCFGITDGSEPLDSEIDNLEKQLAEECTNVLYWQYNCEKESK